MKTLPNFFKPLFWSYKFSAVDPEEQKKLIILNSINYGDLSHWKWITRNYGKKTIKQVLSDAPATALRIPAGRLAELIFGLKLKNVPRRAH